MTDIFSALIRAIADNAREMREGMGDYKGSDGLMHCGRCHAPVKSVIDGLGTVPIMCGCQEEKPKPETHEGQQEPAQIKMEAEIIAELMAEAKGGN